MKKLLFIASIILALGLVFPTFAANNNGVGAQTGQLNATASPTGNQVQNKNQVSTQNQGEDSQLQVSNQEQESLGEGLQIRNRKTIQNMSEVAKQVQQLLKVRTSGGIGDQVREIAQNQDQTQTLIQEQLDKLESKTKLTKFLTGTNLGAIKNLKQQLEQNQLRIELLTELQSQISNQSDITMIKATIEALIQENTSLQEIITAEWQIKSMFGWLFRLFSR